MILEHSNYRTYLRSVLADRMASNPSYSLRAFARSLELSPTSLSQLMNGKVNLSLDTALKVSQKLGLSSTDKEYFSLLVQFDSAKGAELKASLQDKINQLRPSSRVFDLSIDQFKIIAEWHHAALMAMTEMNEPLITPAQMAKRLGLHPIEALAALERLERLELIEKDEQGKFRLAHGRVVAQSQIPNEALRKFHSQMLDKAREAIFSQTPQERFIGSETLSFDSKDLSEVNQAAEEFFQKVLSISRRSKTKHEVFHLGVQFFNLTPNKTQNKIKENKS